MSIDIIFNKTAVPVASYSFEAALYSATRYSIPSNISTGPLKLYLHGCITDRGIFNCTEACQDVNQIFSSAQTLQNCIVFPQISSLLANGSLTKEARAIAIQAGIDEDSYNMSDTIFKTTTGCLQGWCHQIDGCGEDNSEKEHCYDDVYGKSYCFLNLCPLSAFRVNADVGGIGVILLVRPCTITGLPTLLLDIYIILDSKPYCANHPASVQNIYLVDILYRSGLFRTLGW